MVELHMDADVRACEDGNDEDAEDRPCGEVASSDMVPSYAVDATCHKGVQHDGASASLGTCDEVEEADIAWHLSIQGHRKVEVVLDSNYSLP